MPEHSNSKSDRFQTAIAIAIAVTSVVGAIIGGTAARLSSSAGDSQLAGFSAAVNYQKVGMVARTDLYRELRALTSEKQNQVLAEALDADAAAALEAGDAHAAQALSAQADEYRASAKAVGTFVTADYRTQGGRYDEETFLQDQFLYAEQDEDIDSADDYGRTAVFRARAEGLVFSLIGLSLAVLLFTLAEQSQRRWRVLFFGLGAVVLACGLCSAVAGEVIRAWFTGA